MKEKTISTAELLDVLPDEDFMEVDVLVKRFIKKWDPDFTKLTAGEKALMEKSDEEMRKGEYISEKEFWS